MRPWLLSHIYPPINSYQCDSSVLNTLYAAHRRMNFRIGDVLLLIAGALTAVVCLLTFLSDCQQPRGSGHLVEANTGGLPVSLDRVTSHHADMESIVWGIHSHVESLSAHLFELESKHTQLHAKMGSLSELDGVPSSGVPSQTCDQLSRAARDQIFGLQDRGFAEIEALAAGVEQASRAFFDHFGRF